MDQLMIDGGGVKPKVNMVSLLFEVETVRVHHSTSEATGRAAGAR